MTLLVREHYPPDAHHITKEPVDSTQAPRDVSLMFSLHADLAEVTLWWADGGQTTYSRHRG